ncbi:uncharacterized protein LOC115752941 [Rhodamnia argentea]|uniref:Uncharacterized protein LOC115752941 n=1 Tax=Rhodamnia argentea TaxID=178133 RepID=A0A8B8QJ70_9MYRT|nr:uncharacterized protein LOC115752941 [Rhodamnia argentea]
MRKSVALRRRKIHILKTLANSKSVRKSSLISDYLANICKLKLKLEAIRREYSSLIAVKKRCLLLLKNMREPEVKVQKVGDKFELKVNCERREDGLVSILEALDEMGLDVLQARVSCDRVFSMEAFVVAQDQALEASDVAQAILRAMEKQVGEDLVT